MYLDSFFTYKYTIRFLLMNKLGFVVNTFNVPHLKKIHIFFPLKKLEDLDEIQLYNNFYLIKFFLGRNAFFTKTKKYFSLGTWYYSFNTQLIIQDRREIYFLIHYFLNNIFIHVEKNLVKWSLLNKHLNIYSLLIKDLNVYSELKTNLGLFHIKRPLHLKLFFCGCDYQASKLLMSQLKFI